MPKTTVCPKCGVKQDADNPICSHLNGRKGGRLTLRRYGRKHFKRMSALSPVTKRKPSRG
jgi:hypothetical protein